MAVAFDAVGPSSAGAQSAGSATLSWTHTGSGPALLVGVSVDDGSDVGTTCTCTCDAVAMTSLGRVESGTGSIGFLQVFAAAGLAGSSHAIVVTHSQVPTDMEGGSISFTGANTTVAAAFGTPATASPSTGACQVVLGSSTSGNLVAGFLANGNTITSATSPATSRFINNQKGATGNGTGNAAGSTSPAGGSVTVAWTVAATFAALMAVEVQAGGTPAPLVSGMWNTALTVPSRSGWQNAGHSR